MTLICQIIYMYNPEYIKAVYRIKIFQYNQHLVYDYISVGTFNSKSLMNQLLLQTNYNEMKKKIGFSVLG